MGRLQRGPHSADRLCPRRRIGVASSKREREGSAPSEGTKCPVRLEAQVTALSQRERGFESRTGRYTPTGGLPGAAATNRGCEGSIPSGGTSFTRSVVERASTPSRRRVQTAESHRTRSWACLFDAGCRRLPTSTQAIERITHDRATSVASAREGFRRPLR